MKPIRHLAALAFLLTMGWGTPSLSAECLPQGGSPPLAILEVSHTPETAAVGEMLTVSATVQNTTCRLLLANVRLLLPAGLSLVLPDLEQVVFVEAGTTRVVRWQVQVDQAGPWQLQVEPSVISEGRPLDGARARIPEPTAMAFARVWSGTWRSTDGFVYRAKFRARLDPSGAVEGELDWTLKQAPEARQDYADKIGAEGIEYVWGTYDPAGRNLDMEGYRRDDPVRILGLDRYRLTLSEDGAEIKGATWDHGSWKAAFSLRPVDAPRQYSSEDWGFCATFPGEVVEEAVDEGVTFASTDEADTVAYMITARNLSDEVLQAKTTTKMLEDGLRGALDNVGGEMAPATEVTLSGYPGRETVITTDDFTISCRLFIAGRRMYLVLVTATKGAEVPMPPVAFLNSFRLQPGSGATPAPIR